MNENNDVEYKNVYVGETPIDEPVLDVRLRAETPDEEWPGPPYQFVLEAAVLCDECGAKNWLLIGSDPGDYRCIKCTMYL